jgi:hypothetical protein
MVGHTTDADSIERFANAGFDADHLQAEFVSKVAHKFTDYLRDESGTHLTLTNADAVPAMAELCNHLANDGFDTERDADGDSQIAVFAPEKFVNALRVAAGQAHDRDSLGDPVSVYGARVYADTTLDESEVIAIHDDAIAPTPVVETWKPYLVKHPRGVITAEVDA